jgi:TnpA family transposase
VRALKEIDCGRIFEETASGARALADLGRIIKTMHLLNYFDDDAYRLISSREPGTNC